MIGVNWEKIAGDFFYPRVAKRTKPVGLHLALLTDFLCREKGLNPSSITIIGHSLGAHIAGYAASSVTHGRIGRIVGIYLM